ncbi:MAG: DUF4388 domain-containing protein [Desulfobacteraceae bacterium]|nr:DUF4388 domain-containing protein [Candidatus Aminicenantes bacterium]MBL7175341.1 DUF4388 domain-containing protein [Desulfobacteraceae bacterium]
MVLRGELKSFSFAGIINLINEERKTGELVLNDGKATTTIFFRNGQIIFSTGGLSKGMRLGNLLKANDLITTGELVLYLDKAKRSNKRLGEVFVENEVISRDTLKKFLHLQTNETLHGLFLWEEGRFEFKEGLDGLYGDIIFKLDPKQIVFESKKWSKLKQSIPNEHVIFQVQREISKHTTGLKPEELRLVFLIDGKRDVKDLIENTGYPRYLVYSTLYKLEKAGVITHRKAKIVQEEIDVGDLIDKFKLFINIIKLIMEDLREELGKGANKILEQCKKELDSTSQIFLEYFSSSGSLEESLQIQEYLFKSKVKPADMIPALNQIVSSLFNQQSQYLGHKSVIKSIRGLEQELTSLPDYQGEFGKQILQILLERKRYVERS